MYRSEEKQQLSFEAFYLPFGGKLNPNNRWVALAELIPWEEFEEEYASQFAIESGQGAPAIKFRTALGALLIKEKLGITDEETVEQIRETPYLQYLIGMEGYLYESPFDPSMAGRNPTDCCSPKHPGWSILEKESAWICSLESMKQSFPTSVKKKRNRMRKLKRKKILQ